MRKEIYLEQYCLGYYYSTLWSVEDYITSYYNHLAPGDYSRVTKFQNGCLTFCQWFQGSDKLNRRKFNWELWAQNMLPPLAEHFSKERYEVFADWIAWTCSNFLLILIQVIITIVTNYAQCFFYLQNFPQNSKAPEQIFKTKTIMHFRLSEYC